LTSQIARRAKAHRVRDIFGARALAVEAATAIGGDLVGVDLLPEETGGWTVLELNGAVDFTAEYSLGGANVFAEVADALSPAQPLEVAGAAAT